MTLDIEEREIVGGGRVAELGGGGEPFRAGVAIARTGAAVETKHRQRKHRIAVAALGGKLVPFGGFGIVARHAEPVGVKLAEQRHRFGVAFVGGMVGRELKRGEEIAALKGAEGEVEFASARARGGIL